MERIQWFCLILLIGAPICRKALEVRAGYNAKRLIAGEHMLEHGARSRRFILHLPQNRAHEDGLPLVVALHGAPGTGQNLKDNTDLTQKADAAGFIVAFPDGTSATNPDFLNWNSGTCCGYAWENKVDDVGFIRQLVDHLAISNKVDRRRVFAVGYSKGGMMAYRLACEAADVFRGIADISGAFNLDTCKPARAVEMLIMHGRIDQVVRYGEGLPKVLAPLPDTENRPVAYAVDFWQRVGECTPQKVHSLGPAQISDFTCHRGKLRLIALENEGHTWPGGKPGLSGSDYPTNLFSAASAIWDFWMVKPAKAKNMAGN